MRRRTVSSFSGRVAATAAIAAGAVVLAACGGGNSTTRSMTSVLMGPSGGGTADIVGERPPVQTGPGCPQVVIRDGTETLRVYQGGREGDPAQVRYQGSLTRVARECNYNGDNLAMRIGVTGRVLTGPVGQPGNYQMPLRAAFMQPGGEAPLWTQLYQVPVTILPGETNARFSFVAEDLQVALPEGTAGGSYVVYIGFDERS